MIEVGLVEEFFFRALVQSRLAAWFKSEVSGVVVMSIIFGLAHAPGFIFRQAGTVEGLGTNPTGLDAVAYSIVVLAVSGILFGVVWARTKNLFALMLLHAVGDLLPNFADFVKVWHFERKVGNTSRSTTSVRRRGPMEMLGSRFEHSWHVPVLLLRCRPWSNLQRKGQFI